MFSFHLAFGALSNFKEIRTKNCYSHHSFYEMANLPSSLFYNPFIPHTFLSRWHPPPLLHCSFCIKPESPSFELHSWVIYSLVFVFERLVRLFLHLEVLLEILHNLHMRYSWVQGRFNCVHEPRDQEWVVGLIIFVNPFFGHSIILLTYLNFSLAYNMMFNWTCVNKLLGLSFVVIVETKSLQELSVLMMTNHYEAKLK